MMNPDCVTWGHLPLEVNEPYDGSRVLYANSVPPWPWEMQILRSLNRSGYGQEFFTGRHFRHPFAEGSQQCCPDGHAPSEVPNSTAEIEHMATVPEASVTWPVEPHAPA
jgi:hypothetical protein